MSRLKELRVSRGFTQAKMARELDTSQQTISRIEYKDDMIPTDILIKAAKYFNVSVDYMLGLTDDKHNKVSEDRLYRYFKEYESFMLEFAALKPEYQEAVKSVIRTLYNTQNDNA